MPVLRHTNHELSWADCGITAHRPYAILSRWRYYGPPTMNYLEQTAVLRHTDHKLSWADGGITAHRTWIIFSRWQYYGTPTINYPQQTALLHWNLFLSSVLFSQQLKSGLHYLQWLIFKKKNFLHMSNSDSNFHRLKKKFWHMLNSGSYFPYIYMY